MVLFKKPLSSDELTLLIHNEFDTAEERILQQAKDIIAGNSRERDLNAEKEATRLAELGFINSKNVVVYRKLRGKRESIKTTLEQAKLIEAYKRIYPFQKFLTIEELDRICNKYNLVYAPVANYIGEVPRKNAAEIAAAPELDYRDRMTIMVAHVIQRGVKPNEVYRNLKGVTLYTRNGYISELHEAIRQYYFKHALGEYDGETRMSYFDQSAVDFSGLHIAAPRHLFNLKGLKNKGRFQFLKMEPIKDPVVFRYCKGDIIRVETKWGLEASDPMLVNEKLN